MRTMPDRTFHVVAPPPLLFLGGFVLGLALNAWHPLTRGPLPVIAWVGATMALVGVTFALAAAVTFRRAGTGLEPGTAATTLVTTGPYRWSRNPIYVGMTAVSAGLALVLNALWILLTLVVVIGVVQQGVIRHEEGYLSDRFPHEYGAYRARVRRWL